MTEADELIARVLEQFPLAPDQQRYLLSKADGLDHDDTRMIGCLLTIWLHPQSPRKVPGWRWNGLFNHPNGLSSTARWKDTLWDMRLMVEGNPDPDPYWAAWLQHCKTTMAFRAMILEKYRQWRKDRPDEDCPRDDETPQAYYERCRRGAKERNNARERAKLINAI